MIKGLKTIVLFSISTGLFATDIEVSVGDLPSLEGQVVVAIFDQKAADDYPDLVQNAICTATVDAKQDPVTASCKNIAAGKYAVFTFHDANNNGVPDHNFLGLPKEHMGFSNGCKTGLPIPSFKKCNIDVLEQDDSLKLNINLTSFL